jgi:hypothetical protein
MKALIFQPRYLILLTGIVALAACNSPQKTPDVSNIPVSLQTFRFDRDLYHTDTNHIASGMQILAGQYPNFLNFYLDTLLGLGIHGHFTDHDTFLHELLTNKDYRALYDTIQSHFPEAEPQQKELISGFRYLKYYFPNHTIPTIIYFSSQLNKFSAITLDSNIVGIGLDMFLGPKYPFYRAVEIPAYMDGHLRPEYMPVAVFTVIYQDRYPFNPYSDSSGNKTLLNLILQRGREQYFLHQVLPTLPDSTLFGFSQQQLDWCTKNEAYIYNFFVERNLLYSVELGTIIKYVMDGPYAEGLPPQSPGNVGSWLGYRIVSSYMQRHSNTTLQQLLATPPKPQTFLEEAKYRPR